MVHAKYLGLNIHKFCSDILQRRPTTHVRSSSVTSVSAKEDQGTMLQNPCKALYGICHCHLGSVHRSNTEIGIGAARMVCSDYRRTSNVSSMLQLGPSILSEVATTPVADPSGTYNVR